MRQLILSHHVKIYRFSMLEPDILQSLTYIDIKYKGLLWLQ